jgi:hypothetical protein
VRDYLSKHHGTEFDRAFGPKTGKAIMHSTAGRSVMPAVLLVTLMANTYI